MIAYYLDERYKALKKITFSGKRFDEMYCHDVARIYWWCMQRRKRKQPAQQVIIHMTPQRWMNYLIEWIVVQYLPDELFTPEMKYRVVQGIELCNTYSRETSWYGMSLWGEKPYKIMLWWIKHFTQKKKIDYITIDY